MHTLHRGCISASGCFAGTGGDMVPSIHHKLLLDFWLGILLAMATILIVAVVWMIPHVV